MNLRLKIRVILHMPESLAGQNLMKAELAGGSKTGFSPYNKESQIMFDHRWLLLIGVKN